LYIKDFLMFYSGISNTYTWPLYTHVNQLGSHEVHLHYLCKSKSAWWWPNDRSKHVTFCSSVKYIFICLCSIVRYLPTTTWCRCTSSTKNLKLVKINKIHMRTVNYNRNQHTQGQQNPLCICACRMLQCAGSGEVPYTKYYRWHARLLSHSPSHFSNYSNHRYCALYIYSLWFPFLPIPLFYNVHRGFPLMMYNIIQYSTINIILYGYSD
jgi:hypothetical protein